MSGKHVYITNLNRITSRCRATTQHRLFTPTRTFSTSNVRRQNDRNPDKKQQTEPEEKEKGALSRRLSEMAEDAMLEGGRSARKNIQEAGFSGELKAKLEERVAASTFKSDYAAAHSIVDMPESAGQGTIDMASSKPWTGTEETADVTLRMLDDAKPKPIRTPYKIPNPTTKTHLPAVDLRIKPKRKVSPGVRIAEAKERTATYNLSRSPGVSDTEREEIRQELRERFEPGARPMPAASVQGFTSLANERIEDAIARGQFRNIKRGKGVNTQTDHNANSAFMDTTEYFMNKMIQKQELVPPWIEKQQELAREVDRFRQRLRADWRRHAAMIIASEGGPLEAQMMRARAYAAAEERLAERARIEKAFQNGEDVSESSLPSTTEEPSPTRQSATNTTNDGENLPQLPPLRDTNYLSIERPYHEVTIKNLNTLTRSYNLQAPPVARKPYLNLERELSFCFADVAPSLAGEIRRRATEKVESPAAIVHGPSSMFESLSTAQTSRVYDEDRSKSYGFREFWRDLVGRGNK